MIKHLFIFVTLVAYPTFAQISSGTIVVFNFTKNKLIVAADSRGLRDNAGPPDNSYCKITAIGNKFVFATSGSARYTKAPFDTIDSWDNGDLAREAIHGVPKSDNGSDDMTAIATYWAKVVSGKWVSLCRVNYLKCRKVTEASNGVLSWGIFFRTKGLLRSGATITLDTSAINYVISNDLANCWPCGKKHGGRICAGGSHIDVAAKFCSARKANGQIRVRTSLKKADKDTRLAVKIAELTIDAYEKTTGDVGGDVDAVTVTKDGSITWNSHKANCPENQE